MATLHMRFENEISAKRQERIASRGILLRGNEVLLVYEPANDKWMIPGGGREIKETNDECCIREFQEETGTIVIAKKLLLRIREYFDDMIYENNYFAVEYVRDSSPNLTENEKEANMIAKWIKLDSAIDIFSKYKEYEERDPMMSGLYKREHTALSYFRTALFSGLIKGI